MTFVPTDYGQLHHGQLTERLRALQSAVEIARPLGFSETCGELLPQLIRFAPLETEVESRLWWTYLQRPFEQGRGRRLNLEMKASLKGPGELLDREFSSLPAAQRVPTLITGLADDAKSFEMPLPSCDFAPFRRFGDRDVPASSREYRLLVEIGLVERYQRLPRERDKAIRLERAVAAAAALMAIKAAGRNRRATLIRIVPVDANGLAAKVLDSLRLPATDDAHPHVPEHTERVARAGGVA
jgi:hypothetical protein